MRILLATDGSPDAMHAAEWVATSGLPKSASILIVSVVTSLPLLPAAVADGLREHAHTAAVEARGVLGAGDTAVEIRIGEGDVREEIMRVAEEWDADLVVLGSRAVGRAEAFLLGTVSRDVVRHCTRPVLVVKGPARTLRSAVVALDGSRYALSALRFFARWPKPAGLTVHMVGVVEPLPFPRTMPAMILPEVQAAVAAAQGERRHALEQTFEEARPVLAAGGATTETLASGDPAAELLRVARESAADLIVLGARGLGRVQRVLLGSVSETVLRDARCAVLVAARPRASP
jgi:nucleotide-binding universal stress UspA family protein